MAAHTDPRHPTPQEATAHMNNPDATEIAQLSATLNEITDARDATEGVDTNLGVDVENLGDRLCGLLLDTITLNPEVSTTLRSEVGETHTELREAVDYYAALDEHDTTAALDIYELLAPALRLVEYALTGRRPEPTPRPPLELNRLMEFDHVVQVHPDGTVTDAPPGVYAPELHDGELMQGGTAGTGWTLMGGYSNQYGYSGPIMHSSEFVGGGLERDIRAEPGYYVTLADTPSDGGEADGWAVARKDIPDDEVR